MPRNLRVSIALAGVFATACGTKNVPRPSDEAVAANSSSPAAVVETAKTAKPVEKHEDVVVGVPKVEEKSTAALLRPHAARYLESDGRGGWRKNEKAATELEKLTPEQVQQLWPLLKDPQVEVRRGIAVFLLTQFNPANRDQVMAFAALLDDSDRLVRARAIEAVRQFDKADQVAALPQCTGLLDLRREDRPENRAAAIRLLASLRSGAIDSLPALADAASGDPDANVRAAALAATAAIATTKPAIQTLARGLSDKETSVRVVAASRLRQIGSAASPAVDQLAAALGDSSADVAEAAAEALIRIGSPAVPPVVGQLASSNVSARKLALASLAKLGPLAKEAAPEIEKCRQDADPQVRQLAETALKRVAPSAAK